MSIQMHPTLRKTLIFIAKLVVSATMLWFVFSKIEAQKILGLISSARPGWLMAATALFILSKAASAYRLNLFFRSAGLMLPTAYNLKLYLLGMFYNLFLPGGIGGDAYKVILLKRSGGPNLKHLIQATVLDRVTGLTALTIITLVLLLWLPLPSGVVWLLAIAIPAIWLVSREIIKRFFQRFYPIFHVTNLQSAAVQLLQLGTAGCILRATGFEGPALLLMSLFLVSSVMAVIPLTFGGAGAREFTFALASGFLSFDAQLRDHAITLGMVFYLITAVVSLAGLWYVFFMPQWSSNAAGLTDNTQR